MGRWVGAGREVVGGGWWVVKVEGGGDVMDRRK